MSSILSRAAAWLALLFVALMLPAQAAQRTLHSFGEHANAGRMGGSYDGNSANTNGTVRGSDGSLYVAHTGLLNDGSMSASTRPTAASPRCTGSTASARSTWPATTWPTWAIRAERRSSAATARSTALRPSVAPTAAAVSIA